MEQTQDSADSARDGAGTQGNAGLSGEIDLAQVLAHLWGARWTILALALIGAALATAYAVTQPTTHVATAQIRSPSPTELAPLSDIQSLQIGSQQAYRDVIDVLEADEFLAQVYYEQVALRYTDNGLEPPRVGIESPEDLRRVVRLRLPRNLRTSFYNSDISDIEVSYPDEEFAVMFANALVEQANARATAELIAQTRELLAFMIAATDERIAVIRQLSGEPAQADVEAQAPGSDPQTTLDRDAVAPGERPYRSEFFSETMDELQYRRAILADYSTRSFEDLSLIRVHEKASLPAETAGPHAIVLTVMGLVIGALLGFLVALLLAVKKGMR